MSVGQFIRQFFKGLGWILLGFLIVSVVMVIADYFNPGAGEAFLNYVVIFNERFSIPLGDAFKDDVWPFIQALLEGLGKAFIFPVVTTLGWTYRQIGFWPYGYGWWLDQAHNLFTLVLSWMFWSTVYVRSFHFFGLWNAFFNCEDRKKGVVLGYWVKLRDWWEMFTKFGKGVTAKWASLAEVINSRFCGGDVFLGRPKLFVGGMMRPVGISTEKHMVTIAGTGSGKSTAALIPNLCLHEGSLLCVDPKGELAGITAHRRWRGNRKGYGLDQGIAVLDPFRLVLGPEDHFFCYNPFEEIARVSKEEPDRAVSYASKIAEALVKPTSQKDTYWDDAARTLIRGLVLFVFVHEPEDMRNLVRMRQLIMEGDVAGFEEAVEAGVIDPKKDKDLNPFDFLLERMKDCRDGPYGDAIASAASSITMMGDNQAGSVITTAQQHTSFLELPEIRRVCEKSDFFLDDLKKERWSIYLVLPINHLKGDAGRWLRMFVLLFIDMMMRIQEAPKPPVLLAIDEFPSLGRLEGIEVVAPVMRSYGVRFWAVAQDISQLQAVYPDHWTGFLGGAEAIQFMGVNHQATVDFIVDLLGKGEVIRGGGQRQWKEERPLLDREQVSRFLSPKHKNQIVWFGHRRPMKLKICPYYEYFKWWYYNPDKRFREKFWPRVWRFIFGKQGG